MARPPVIAAPKGAGPVGRVGLALAGAALLAGCPASTLVGQPCDEAGEKHCEEERLIRCDGRAYRLLAECSSECQAGKPFLEHTEAVIDADETWQCLAGPHRIGTTITIAPGATLTIEAGAVVSMVPASRIVADVAARVDALGTEEAPILVTADNGQRGGYGAGQEGGINVFAVQSGAPSRIEHTIFELGIHGLGVFGLASDATAPVVENNTFRDQQRFGIVITCNEADPPIPDFEATNEFFGNLEGAVSPCP
jgi:hypothetical protein